MLSALLSCQLAAMLNTFHNTVFERSFARLWAQADGTGEFMMILLGEPIQTNFGCSEAHRQSPLSSSIVFLASSKFLLERAVLRRRDRDARSVSMCLSQTPVARSC